MKLCVFLYRVANWFHRLEIPLIPHLITYFVRIIFGCWVPASLSAGRDLTLGYGGLGIVIHNEAVVGDNVHIDQNVTIGGNAIEPGVPVLGSNVYVGAGAKLLGPIVIGDNVLIGANAVVVRDVRSGTVVVGCPAREVRSGIILKDLLWHTKSRG